MSADNRVRLDLDKPFGIDKADHLDEGAGGANIAKILAVCPRRVSPMRNIGEHHARARYVLKASTSRGNCLLDDLQAALCLLIYISRDGAVFFSRDRSRAGHGDMGSHPNGAREADLRFQG